MWFNVASFQIVHITVRSFCKPLATAKFLAKPTLYIFNEIIRKILALSERHLQHEFPLRSWLKPKLRKAQRSNSVDVHKVDNFTAINRITGETIGVPCQNAKWFITCFNILNHFGELVSPGLLCAFRFRKLTDNLNAFSLGKFAQFKSLSFYAHHLFIV